ncbi:unnamed protein product [Coffea canephora]|uniref:Uncharacterized protein n=1 Tax=Coffea canephora TaxID=49390 RepID=A0A068UQP8_COFCA|nr:unnamed protein product [Coffea canephora]
MPRTTSRPGKLYKLVIISECQSAHACEAGKARQSYEPFRVRTWKNLSKSTIIRRITCLNSN